MPESCDDDETPPVEEPGSEDILESHDGMEASSFMASAGKEAERREVLVPVSVCLAYRGERLVSDWVGLT